MAFSSEQSVHVDYTLGRDETGRHFAEFSMGHEALGRWLSDELGTDLSRIDHLLDTLARLQQRSLRDFELQGSEFSLNLTREEAQVRAHILEQAESDHGFEDLNLYDDELEAGCGLDDFKAVLHAWRALIAG